MKLGFIERFPYSETTEWCHWMVAVRKKDSGPGRCADVFLQTNTVNVIHTPLGHHFILGN